MDPSKLDLGPGEDTKVVQAYRKTPGASHMAMTYSAVFGAATVAAFAKTRSLPLLLIGTGAAACYGVAARLISQGDDQDGYALGAGASGAVVAASVSGAVMSGGWLPAATGIIGLSGAAYYGYKYKTNMDDDDEEEEEEEEEEAAAAAPEQDR